MSALDDWRDPYGCQDVSLAEDVISELLQQVASLEGERDRLRAALEAIADDVEEWEMKLVAMKSLEKIDND